MNYGDFPIEETIHVFFTTRAFATGIPGTLSAATVAIYEDITATPIETSVAVTESLNSIVGLNAVPIVAIAASGYEVGKNYHIVIEAGTVDSVSVVGEVVAYFSIGRSAAAVDLANGTDGLGAIKAETALIVGDTGELQTDWADGGRLDLIQDIIAVDTTTDIPALIATAQADLDTITGTAGVLIGTDAANVTEISDAVWDEDATGHQTGGTFGQAIGDPAANTETIYDAVVTDATGINVATDVVAVKAETVLVLADTADIQPNYATEAKQDTAQTDLDTITGTSGVLIGTDAANVTEISDAVWDETLTGSNHNNASSAGKRLRQLEQAFVHHSGALGTVTNARTMILTGGVATDNYYLGDRLQITEGTGLGQSRVIIKYVGSTATATLDSDFITTPVATTSLFDIVAADVHVATSDADLAEGYFASVADTSNVTMDAITSVSATDYYKGDMLVITHGTGIGQSREITSQTGRALVVSPAFVTLPDTTSAFHVMAVVSANDALDTAIAELGVAAPTATPTIRSGLMLLYMALRNKTVVQTSGTDALEIYNNAGTKIAAKLLTDDGSDYTEAEMA